MEASSSSVAVRAVLKIHTVKQTPLLSIVISLISTVSSEPTGMIRAQPIMSALAPIPLIFVFGIIVWLYPPALLDISIMPICKLVLHRKQMVRLAIVTKAAPVDYV